MKLFRLLSAGILTLFWQQNSHAFITPLSADLRHDILSETVPTAFEAFPLKLEDYQLRWVGAPIDGVELGWAAGSLQWVRVAEVLSLPRARFRATIKSRDPLSGVASNAGFHQVFSKNVGGASDLYEVYLPVALLSGEKNLIELRIKRGQEILTGTIQMVFKARSEMGESRAFSDASCSRFGVRVEGAIQSSKNPGWMYVGCRFVELDGEPEKASSLEVFVFWDQAGQSLQLNGVPVSSSSLSVSKSRKKLFASGKFFNSKTAFKRFSVFLLFQVIGMKLGIRD